MDIRMPNLDGIEATRRITAAAGSPRVLILTTFDLDQYVYEALRAGATCSSATPRSRPTSRGSSASSACMTGPKPSCSPAKPAWCSPAAGKPRTPEAPAAPPGPLTQAGAIQLTTEHDAEAEARTG